MLEDDYSFNCPHCFETISIRIDITGGKRQRFTYDCEVCCRPIVIELEIEDGEVSSFSAEGE